MADARLRLLCLKGILEQETDEAHGLTQKQLLTKLSERGFSVERRALYADIRLLREAGMDIERRRTDTQEYYLASRPFELAELKLLVDAVQASRFVTRKKSEALIAKLRALASRPQSAGLSRQVYIQNRIKQENESIYYNVDSIYAAIGANRKIRFTYAQYTLSRDLKPRRGGAPYTVSPYLLMWADGNYYLVADHEEHAGLVHFRVDKMLRVSVLEEKRKPCLPMPDGAAYARTLFSMYAGERMRLTLRFDRSLVGVAVDRFGRELSVLESDESGFAFRAEVAVSPAFFGWLFQFGDKAKLLGPPEARAHMEAQLQNTARVYAEP